MATAAAAARPRTAPLRAAPAVGELVGTVEVVLEGRMVGIAPARELLAAPMAWVAELTALEAAAPPAAAATFTQISVEISRVPVLGGMSSQFSV